MKPLKTIRQGLIECLITDEENNFVLLGEGRFSKVYLMALKNSRKNDIESYIALKIQRDDYPDLGNICNPHIERMWKDEYRNLQALSQYAHVVHIKDIIEQEENEDKSPSGPLLFTPLCYCTQKKVFFYLPCPDSGSHMENYKIANHYKYSAERFIYSSRQKSNEGITKIYTRVPSPRNKLLTIALKYEPFLNQRSIQEVQSKMRRAGHDVSSEAIVKVEKPGRKWAIVENGKQKYFILKEAGRNSLDVYLNPISVPENTQILYQEDLLESLSKNTLQLREQEYMDLGIGIHVPCLDCEVYREDNFSRCPWFKLFSFYEFYAIPMELCHFPFKYLNQALSQRPMAGIREEAVRDRWYFSYLFPEEERIFSFKKNPEKRTLEVLSHKLSLFSDICTAVGSVHQKTSMAHMHLVPEHLMVQAFLDVQNYEFRNADRQISPLEKGGFRPVLLDIAGLSSLNETKSDFPPIGNHSFLNSITESDSLKNKIAEIDRGMTVSGKSGFLAVDKGNFQIFCNHINFQVEDYHKGDWVVWECKNSEGKSEWGKIVHVEEHSIRGKIWQQETPLPEKKPSLAPASLTYEESGIFEVPMELEPISMSPVNIAFSPKKSTIDETVIVDPALPMGEKAEAPSISVKIKEEQEPEKEMDAQWVPVQFKQYPGYGPHYDLYGLGKLLMYVLFSNDKVSMDEINNSIKNFSKYHGLKEEAQRQEIEEKILSHVEQDPVFKWRNLCYETPASEPKHGNVWQRVEEIVKDVLNEGDPRFTNIWKETLFLVFALLTTEFKHFSYSKKEIEGEELMAEIVAKTKKIREDIAEILYSQVKFYEQNNRYEMEIDQLREQVRSLEKVLKEVEHGSVGDKAKKILKRIFD